MTFEMTFIAGWGDMDFNQHMANTAYLEKAGDVRFKFLMEHGFGPNEFAQRQIGPVVMKDEVEYYREFRLHDEMRVNHLLAAASEDGSKQILRNEFYKGDKLAARVNTLHGWVDLRERKYIAPPPDLLAVNQMIPKSEDFRVL